jgi:hypothetical protein
VIPPKITPVDITITDDDSNGKWAKLLEEMLENPKSSSSKVDISQDLLLSSSSTSASRTITLITSSSETSTASSNNGFNCEQPGPSSKSHGLTLPSQERDIKILENVQFEEKNEWSAITKMYGRKQ